MVKLTQRNSYSVAAAYSEKERNKETLQWLGELGISYFKATQLTEKYGHERVAEVIKNAKAQKRTNPAGYVIRALV